MSPNNFTQAHVMKIEWLVTDVTPVESPDRAERAMLGVIWLSVCWPIQDVFVVGEATL